MIEISNIFYVRFGFVLKTFTGKLMISINPMNPMKTVDLYSEENMVAYRLKTRGSMPPHVYSIGKYYCNKNVREMIL